MNITTEPLENRQLRLTIEVDEEKTRQAMRRAARQISKQARIPGFRQGKAPYEVVQQRFGEDTILNKVLETLPQDLLLEVMKEQDLQLYAPAELEDIQTDPLVLQYVISLHPVIDLGNYREYRLKFQEAQVSEEEVQQALQDIQQQNVNLDPVERPAALGDGAMINLVGTTTDGNQFLAQKQLRVALEGEEEQPTPGFIENVVGMQVGDERSFTLVLPDDFPDQSLQGQEAEFTVEMLKVYDRTVPDLDDDLARAASSLETLEELKQHLTAQLEQKARQENDQAYADQVIQDLLEQAQIEYPPQLLEKEVDVKVQEYAQTVKQQLKLSLEDYLRYQGHSMEELRQELTPQARDDIDRALLLGQVVVQENLTVNDEEIEAYIEQLSAGWGDQAEEVRTTLGSPDNRDVIHRQLLGEKAKQRLVAIAQGEAPELESTQEPAKDMDDAAQDPAAPAADEGETV